MPKHFLTAIAVAFLVTNLASAASFIQATDRYANPISLRIIEKQECVSRLQDLFAPEKIISAGLSAIQEKTVPVQCLSDLVEDERLTLDSMFLPLPPPDPGSATPFPYAKLFRMSELPGKLLCRNPHSPGVADFGKYAREHANLCQNKWLSETEAASLKAEDLKIRREFADWQKAAEDLNLLAGKIADAFTPRYVRDEKRIRELNLKVDCYNPNEPGTPEFEKTASYNAERCHGNWQTKKQREAASNALSQFNKANDAAEIAWKAERAKSMGYIQSELKKPGIDLRAISLELEAGTLAKRFANFFENRAKWFTAYQLKVEKFPAEKAAVLAGQLKIYADARLFAKYSAYLNHDGDPANLDSFCADYEKIQNRDARFAKSGVRVTIFNSANDWKFARDYGLSEGEFSAVREYTAGAYTDLNRALREPGSLPEKFKLYKEVLDQALEHLPIYRGPPVVRIDMPPAELLELHQPGKIIPYPAYTSTSKDPEWVIDPEGLPKHNFTLHLHSRGRDIEELSAHPGEAEVLVKAGTRFKVISRQAKPYSSAL
jgi:hypothetical protein